MSKTTRLLATLAFSVLALLALAGTASAQTVDTTPGVGGTGYVAGVTTIAPSAEVQGAQQVQPRGALPFTGSDSVPIIQIGAALVAAGAIVTFAVRRHHAAEQA